MAVSHHRRGSGEAPGGSGGTAEGPASEDSPPRAMPASRDEDAATLTAPVADSSPLAAAAAAAPPAPPAIVRSGAAPLPPPSDARGSSPSGTICDEAREDSLTIRKTGACQPQHDTHLAGEEASVGYRASASSPQLVAEVV